MLQILIVDDEPFFLEFMKDFFQKHAEGGQVVGAVADGRKAMEILQKQSIDVIFTDIKMPVMDGLELICSAMELNPSYQFVVLSSYSDFHMVGQAFKLGAKEYLLKSEITTEQMLDILQKCEERKQEQLSEKQRLFIQKERFAEMSAQLSSLQNMMDHNRSQLKKNFFADIFRKNMTFGEARKLPYAQAFLPEQLPTVCVLIRLDDYYRLLDDTWQGDYFLFEFAMHNIFEEICGGFSDTVFFCYQPDQYVLFTSAAEIFDLKCKIHDLYTAVKQAFQNSLLMETIIASSEISTNSGKTAAQMYEEASRAQSFFFLQGKDCLLCPQKTEALQGDALSLDKTVSQFRQVLNSKDTKALQDSMGNFMISPEEASFSQIQQIRSTFLRYAFYIREYAAENNTTQRLQEDLDYFDHYLKDYGTLTQMNQWLEKIITVLLQQEYHSSSLVKRVKKYVLANYFQEMSLTDIAEAMGVNPNYLSRSFSKEYGDSLISYINTVRLQAAANLLKNTNLKNYEIAEKVGYQNVEHFSRIFKKVLGKTPGEYRNEEG